LNRTVVLDIMPNVVEAVAKQFGETTFVDLRGVFGGAEVTCPGPSPSCALWSECHGRRLPGVNDTTVLCDYIHMSDRGYHAIAEAVHRAIVPLPSSAL
jgi:lysophospholipase L1-like esterase